MNKKKLLLISIFLIVAIMLLTTGCRPEEIPPDEPPAGAPETPARPGDENVDEDLTSRMLEEEEIQAGQVYQQNGQVVATMVIKEGVEQDDIDRLANDYANELKEKYPDKRVNVQAVQGGNNVANIELD